MPPKPKARKSAGGAVEKVEKAERKPARFEEKEVVIGHDTGPKGTQKHYFCSVKQVRFNEEQAEWEYFIHWNGWKAKYDEWILDSDTRLATKTDDLVALMQSERAEKQGRKLEKRKVNEGSTVNSRSSTPSTEPSSSRADKTSDFGAPAPKKRRKSGVPDNVESAQEHSRKTEIKIRMPAEFKEALVDDYACINGEQPSLHRVPARHSVHEIIEEYVAVKEADTTMTEDERSVHIETARGVKLYFDTAIGSQLLYKFERAQYEDYMKELGAVCYEDNPDAAAENMFIPSNHYGFIHLTRLFTRLGLMMTYTPLTRQSMVEITRNLDDFMAYLKDNYTRYWSIDQDYEVATVAYQKRIYEM